MKKLMLSLFTAAVAAAAVHAAPTPVTNTYTYKGKLYSANVDRKGNLYNISFGSLKNFIGTVSMLGSYPPVAKEDTRMFMHDAKNFSGTMETLKDNKVKLVYKGTIGNKNLKEAAEYEETIVFSPEKIKVHFKITQKAAMKSKAHVFWSINNIKPSTLVDKGMMTKKGKEEKPFAVAPSYIKGKTPDGIGCTELKISLEPGVFELEAEKGAVISLMDCRSWGENNYRFDLHTAEPWTHHFKTFPAGKVWEWGYTYKFEPFED